MLATSTRHVKRFHGLFRVRRIIRATPIRPTHNLALPTSGYPNCIFPATHAARPGSDRYRAGNDHPRSRLSESTITRGAHGLPAENSAARVYRRWLPDRRIR